MLIVGSEKIIEQLTSSILKAFNSIIPPQNFFFLNQPSFYGLNKTADTHWFFDNNSPKRLHNHGQMVMQKVMNNQIFYHQANKNVIYLTRKDFFSILQDFDDLVSYNIEDLDYLTCALDFKTLGLAVEMGKKDFGMMMEIMKNNQERPIKGGMCAFDPKLGRDVMVESFQLKNYSIKDIIYLNKNFNHYPNPVKVLEILASQGLFMPVSVKENKLYFQPVQGDLNFLTKTLFFSRQNVKAINSLKSPSDIDFTLKAMTAQDNQKDFKEFASNILT
jgi:hypothetical protein